MLFRSLYPDSPRFEVTTDNNGDFIVTFAGGETIEHATVILFPQYFGDPPTGATPTQTLNDIPDPLDADILSISTGGWTAIDGSGGQFNVRLGKDASGRTTQVGFNFAVIPHNSSEDVSENIKHGYIQGSPYEGGVTTEVGLTIEKSAFEQMTQIDNSLLQPSAFDLFTGIGTSPLPGDEPFPDDFYKGTIRDAANAQIGRAHV